MNGESTSELLRISDAARRLAVSRSLIYLLMDRGDLEYVRIGRCRRIPQRALDDLIGRNLVAREHETTRR